LAVNNSVAMSNQWKS